VKPRRLTKAEVVDLAAHVLEEPAPSLRIGLARLFLALTCATTTDRDELLAARKAWWSAAEPPRTKSRRRRRTGA
jgi:hypothetical protein